MSDYTKFRRSEAFFGRRKAKGLSERQETLFDKLLPALKLDIDAPPVKSLNELFGFTPDKFVMEIGFGGGEHLANQANVHPKTGFIGIEPFVNSMAKMLNSIEKADTNNVRLFDDDAVIVLDWLPDASLDRIDLLYPDPWPKKRHWKRRFVNKANLDRIARVLKPGGKFHFASDIATYINWTLNHCEKHSQFEWAAENSQDWHAPYADWIRTRYEAKAIREERTPCYLRFSRV